METKKAIMLGIGLLTIAVTGNIIANALYTRTKIDVDWKKIAIAGGIGLGVGFSVMKFIK